MTKDGKVERNLREQNKWQEYEKRKTKVNFKMCVWNVISERSVS